LKIKTKFYLDVNVDFHVDNGNDDQRQKKLYTTRIHCKPKINKIYLTLIVSQLIVNTQLLFYYDFDMINMGAVRIAELAA
jgi:hypothetical protein